MMNQSRSRASLIPPASLLLGLLAWLLASACASHVDPEQAVDGPGSSALSAPEAAYPVAAEALRAASIQSVQRRASAAYFVADMRAQNPAHRFTVEFDEHGVTLQGTHSSYKTQWQLVSLGRGDARQAAPAVAPTATGNEVRYERPGLGVSEWYLNGPLGLEQGFDIHTRPAGAADDVLVVELALNGDLRAHQTGSTIALQNGDTKLAYAELYASDADGTPLTATMHASDAGIEIHVADAAAIYPISIDPIVYEQTDKLNASDAAAGAKFGISIAVDGDLAIVGAEGADDDVGAAYVMLRAGDQWNEEAKLSPADAPADALFGCAVAIDGDYAAVGAKGDDFSKGAVYIFKRDSMVWTQQTKLKAGDSQGADELGYSVALDGDTVAAGAPGDDDKGDKAGAAYVFVRDMMDAWTEQQKLTGSDGASLDGAGRSVAIIGDTVSVGTPYADDGMLIDTGAVYTFTRDMMDV
jgi:hypothetical protein